VVDIPRFDSVQVFILKKLVRLGYIGHSHTSIDNLPKGLPSHVRGEVPKAVKKLVKAGYLIPHPTSYGVEVAVNPAKVDEIEELSENP
jgi:hypothetical protein